MSSSKPPWWRAFDRAERAIGRPLENAVDSNAYVSIMVSGMRIQRALVGIPAKAVGGTVGTVLRAANLPTREDVRNLSRQMATLTTEVRALAAAQQQAIDASRERAAAPDQAAESSQSARRPRAATRRAATAPSTHPRHSAPSRAPEPRRRHPRNKEADHRN